MGLLIAAALTCWAIIGFGTAAILAMLGIWQFSIAKGVLLTLLIAAWRIRQLYRSK